MRVAPETTTKASCAAASAAKAGRLTSDRRSAKKPGCGGATGRGGWTLALRRAQPDSTSGLVAWNLSMKRRSSASCSRQEAQA
jgi:hypothetical protein